MDDIEQKIRDLINSDPLPENAEAQLDALIEELPEAERQLARGSYHEALALAVNTGPAGPTVDRIELDF